MKTESLADQECHLLFSSRPITRLRLPAFGRCTFHCTDQPTADLVSAQLVDLSEDGVGLRTSRAVVAGTRIVLEMRPARGQPLKLEAIVNWFVEDARTGQVRLGCAWVRELTADEMWPFCVRR